jgi:hypothetical protein
MVSHSLDVCNTGRSTQDQSGLEVSAETLRRYLGELGYLWKRAKLAAKDDDPQRIEKLARIRWIIEHLTSKQLLLFVDELDIQLLSKVGYQWMARCEQEEVLTPGQDERLGKDVPEPL